MSLTKKFTPFLFLLLLSCLFWSCSSTDQKSLADLEERYAEDIQMYKDSLSQIQQHTDSLLDLAHRETKKTVRISEENVKELEALLSVAQQTINESGSQIKVHVQTIKGLKTEKDTMGNEMKGLEYQLIQTTKKLGRYQRGLTFKLEMSLIFVLIALIGCIIKLFSQRKDNQILQKEIERSDFHKDILYFMTKYRK